MIMRNTIQLKIFTAFAIIYFVWGSTFLAIHFALETIPPFFMAGSRFLIAGSLLFGWQWWKSAHRPTVGDWKKALLSGMLMIFIANGSIAWAEQYIPSGLAALLSASISIWMVVFGWVFAAGSRPNKFTLSGVLLGMTGVALLTGMGTEALDTAAGSGSLMVISALVVIAGAASWALGSLYSRQIKTGISFLYLLSMQMLLGGAALLLLGLVQGEWQAFSIAKISAGSGAALVYLVVIGTLVAYSAYVWLLKVSTPDKVGTYAFFNPVVAVFIGWWLVNEPVTLKMLLGAAAILFSILLINRPRILMAKLATLKSAQSFTFQKNFRNLKAENEMIARTWQGTVPTEKADQYFQYLQKTGLSDYRNIQGNQGIYVFRREAGDMTHFMLLTLWNSEEAIKEFAGEDAEKAHYYPEEKDFLLKLEPNATHYNVALQPGGNA